MPNAPAASPIVGSQLRCDARGGATQSTCSLAPAGEAQVSPAGESAAVQGPPRIVIIPMRQTPSGAIPQIQADGQPFKLVCDPQLAGRPQRCRAIDPNAPAAPPAPPGAPVLQTAI